MKIVNFQSQGSQTCKCRCHDGLLLQEPPITGKICRHTYKKSLCSQNMNTNCNIPEVLTQIKATYNRGPNRQSFGTKAGFQGLHTTILSKMVVWLSRSKITLLFTALILLVIIIILCRQ
jgi:hypothetical protein